MWVVTTGGVPRYCPRSRGVTKPACVRICRCPLRLQFYDFAKELHYQQTAKYAKFEEELAAIQQRCSAQQKSKEWKAVRAVSGTTEQGSVRVKRMLDGVVSWVAPQQQWRQRRTADQQTEKRRGSSETRKAGRRASGDRRRRHAS